MNEIAAQSNAAGLLLTGGATMLVVTSTVLVVAVVVVPRLRPTLGLVSAVLALLGALLVSFTTQSTPLGDPVFRGATVWWSIGLAILSSTWWWIGTSKDGRRQRATRVPTTAGATATRGGGGSSAAGGGSSTDDGGRRSSRARVRPADAALVALGAVTLVVAIGTFLVASGLAPMGGASAA